MILINTDMGLDLDYGELNIDDDFVDVCENLNEQLIEVKKILDTILPLRAMYDKMSLPAQIELDLTLAMALAALQWTNLRIQGIDPNTHPVKYELERVRAAVKKWRDHKSRHKRPTLNVDVARRFIMSGLYDRHRSERREAEPPNKIQFDNEE